MSRNDVVHELMTYHGYTHERAVELVERCRDWLHKEAALPHAEQRTARQLADMFAYRFKTSLPSEDFA